MITNREFITYKKEGEITIVTVNRPPVNALNTQLEQELKQVFEELCEQEPYGVVILTGEGRAFIAGADIKNLANMDSKGAYEMTLGTKDMLSFIENCPKIVIAAINGLALGGGCEVAMVCDIRVIDESTIIGLPEVSLGVLPGAGGTQRLARLVGPGKAKELIFTGDPIKADEAFRIGLVERIAPKGEALNEAKKIAERILLRGPVAVANSKKSINNGFVMTSDEGFKAETQLFSDLFETEDQKEGAIAFMEKRSPDFKGK